ncbi:MAG: LemA family protein [Longimicrobiales bacterium]
MLLELAVLAVIVVVVAMMYNSLVRLRETADGAWADVDVQLKRRHDLIPNLVETVKGYATHEKGTFEAVVEARSRAMNASGPAESAAAENMLTGALKSLFALAENYPQLRASENFGRLQSTLFDLEDDIQKSRRYYNAVVRDYNTKIGVVPTNLVARTFGFREREFFEAEIGERQVPKVDFGDSE